jgi:catalase
VKLDTDHHTRDLFEAIGRGEHPSWTLKMQIMPFDEAKTYRFNPFDLTKVWPHGDYPLIEVGKLTLDRNPTDHHSQIEQGAWEPSNMVPGIGASPDKMLLGRMFAYADAHRYRIGANYNQLPVNAPKSPVHSYSAAGHGRYELATDPVYAPNYKGGPRADTARYGESAGWHTEGDMVRTAYTLRAEDDDWGPGRHAGPRRHGRCRVGTIGGQCRWPTSGRRQRTGAATRLRVLAHVDRDIGDRIEKGVRQ